MPKVERLSYEMSQAAQYNYWQLVEGIVEGEHCSYVEARRLLHEKVDPSLVTADHATERMYQVAVQLVPISESQADLIDESDEDETRTACGNIVGDDDLTLERVFSESTHSSLDYLCLTLSFQHMALLEELTHDLVYGYDAKFELESNRSNLYDQVREHRRVENLHPNLQMLNNICRQFRWICTVHYPWNHPDNPFPGCLVVLNDGFLAFRMDVLDPLTCDRFKVLAVNDRHEDWFKYTKHKVKPGNELTLHQFAMFLEDSRKADFQKHGLNYTPAYPIPG